MSQPSLPTGPYQSLEKDGRKPAAKREEPVLHGKLPPYGQAYLSQLIGEFRALKNICEDDKAKEFAQELVKRAEDPVVNKTMTWRDAYMLDTAIAQMLPVEYLHQRAWCLEVKYRDAVGNADAFDAFMKSESKDMEHETEAHLRARVHNLIRELYRLYIVISCRGDMREDLSKKALSTLAIVLVVIAIIVGTEHFLGLPHYVDVWCMVFAAGATGGLLSLQRRLQSLPSYGESLSDLVELSGRMTVRLTPIIGGVFAIVLFLIFASGLASGTLFPTLPKLDASDFMGFIEHLQPEDASNWGKLLLWSFIAGFAERFVPDTLDRLIARSEQSKNKVK
jgi:hypothetical protein